MCLSGGGGSLPVFNSMNLSNSTVSEKGDPMLQINKIGNVICAHGVNHRRDRAVGVYAFLMDGILIDSGPQILLDDFIPFFQSQDFDKVVFTHHHEDHTGGGKWLQDHIKTPLYIHEAGIEILSKEGVYPPYRQFAWGMREAFHAEPLETEFSSRNGKWKVIHTPGHADDHVALYNETERVMFTGDLYVTPKPKVVLEFDNIPVIKESIKKLLAYDFTGIFCSHAGYVENGREMLEMKLEYLETKIREIIELDAKGYSPKEIQEKLLKSSNPLVEFSEGEWDSIHFVHSVLSYEKNKENV